MKRVLAIILALALVLSCTAALATDYPLTAEKETFKLIIRVRPLHGNPDEMELFKRMEELTNVHIEWEQIQQAEYDEKKSLLLGANKNLSEGFFGKYSLDSSDLVTYGSQGILLPLNDLIEENAPNLKALFERRPDIKAMVTAPDGNIYSTPYVQEGEDGTIASNIMINKTWLERLGLEKPTTLEEFEAVLTAFKEQDANGNGDPNDEIPMTFKYLGSQRDIGGFFGAFGYADTLTENGSHIVVGEDGKLVFVPTTEGYKEGCKYLYEHFFSKGLIDMEGFTMDKKTYNSQNQGEIANIGVFMCWNSFDLGTVHEDEYEPLSPLLGPNGTTSWGRSPDSTMTATGFSITNVCHDPALLMKWVDTFYDPIWSMQCDLGPIGINIKDNGDGTYDYIDVPEGMSYDEFRYKEAFASDGPIALTSEFFGSKIPRSAGHQATFERNRDYDLPYATSIYLPRMI
ncbi:MAG: extracellular solute-binding protein, partial [Clostridia bacterium]